MPAVLADLPNEFIEEVVVIDNGSSDHTAPLARADGDSPDAKPAPRTTAEVDGVSIVLISTGGKMTAFVDRAEDNAPVLDAELNLQTADGKKIELTQVSKGLFVGPFDRTGRMRDAFFISIRSADGTGDAMAEIRYDDLPAGDEAASPHEMRYRIAIALVSAAIGAILGSAALLWLRGRRQRLAELG